MGVLPGPIRVRHPPPRGPLVFTCSGLWARRAKSFASASFSGGPSPTYPKSGWYLCGRRECVHDQVRYTIMLQSVGVKDDSHASTPLVDHRYIGRRKGPGEFNELSCLPQILGNERTGMPGSGVWTRCFGDCGGRAMVGLRLLRSLRLLGRSRDLRRSCL